MGLLVVLALAVFFVTCCPADASDACSVRQAERDVARARARLREAQRVLENTRRFSDQYGARVGRWVRLARRVGFRWDQLATAMYVIDRESNGDPLAKCPTSTASGLWQFLAGWWAGKWDPFSARASMRHAHKAVNDVGWSPWGM